MSNRRTHEDDERLFSGYMNNVRDERFWTDTQNRAEVEIDRLNRFNPGNRSGLGYGGREDPAIVDMDPPETDYGKYSSNYTALINQDPTNKLREESLRKATNGNLKLSYTIQQRKNSHQNDTENLLWENENENERESSGYLEKRNQKSSNKRKQKENDSDNEYVENDESLSQDRERYDYSRAGRRFRNQTDPTSRGKTWLLKQLKLKFMQYQTPVLNFVRRYVAQLEGPSTTEESVYKYIKVLPKIESLRPSRPEDFSNIVEELYSENPELAQGILAFLMQKIESKSKISRLSREMEIAASRMPGESEDIRRNRMISAKMAMIEALRENAMVDDGHFSQLGSFGSSVNFNDTLDSTHRNLALKLWNKYKYMERGTVNFLLDGVLRASAENTLADINGKCHGNSEEDYFTLLEIMNSDVVLTKFINMMLLFQQSNPNSIQPILTNTSYSKGYGTIADRVNSGLYSGRGGGRYNVIQSRPTLFNIMASNLEYSEGIKLFQRVTRDPSGESRLIWDINGTSNSYYGSGSGSKYGNSVPWPPVFPGLSEARYEKVGRFGNSRSRQTIEEEIYWDSTTGSYNKRPIAEDKKLTSELFEAENTLEKLIDLKHKDKSERPMKKIRLAVPTKDGGSKSVKVKYHKPLYDFKTVSKDTSYRSIGSKGRFHKTPPPDNILHYKNPKTNQSQFVNSAVFSDPQALTEMWETGIPPEVYTYTR